MKRTGLIFAMFLAAVYCFAAFFYGVLVAKAYLAAVGGLVAGMSCVFVGVVKAQE